MYPQTIFIMLKSFITLGANLILAHNEVDSMKFKKLVDLPQRLTSIFNWIELSVKSSKESTEIVSLLKTGNKVVEVGLVSNKVEDNNSMRRGPSGKQTGYHYLTDNSDVSLSLWRKLCDPIVLWGQLCLEFATVALLVLMLFMLCWRILFLLFKQQHCKGMLVIAHQTKWQTQRIWVSYFVFVEKLKGNKLLDIPHIANSKFTLC